MRLFEIYKKITEEAEPNSIWYVCLVKVNGKIRKIQRVIDSFDDIKSASLRLEKERKKYQSQIDSGTIEISLLDSTESDPKEFIKSWNNRDEEQ